MNHTPRDTLRSHGVPEPTIEKFLSFHRDNPGVWKAFEHFATQAAEAKAQIGAKAIMERVRWDSEVRRKTAFKCNNNYTAYYARIFAAKYPQHETIFEFRHIKGLKNEENDSLSMFDE